MKQIVYAFPVVFMCALLLTISQVGYGADSTALSDEAKEEALVHFQKGQSRFSQGEYLLAVEHFKLAYEITHSPEILYNIAKCYEEEDEKNQAVAYYKEYLVESNGDDAAAVRAKIEELGGGAGAVVTREESSPPPSHGAAEDDTPAESTKKRRIDHSALELDMGPGFVLLTPDTGTIAAGATEPKKHNYFSIDVLLHFFLNDWFAISAVLLMGPYMEGDVEFIARDPKGHLGLGLGIGMKKVLKDRASLFTNILLTPCAIWREGMTRRATWIALDIRLGLNIRITKKLELNLVAVAEGGPAFVIKPASGGEWDRGVLLSVGPRLGLTYQF